jgi:hypothetical protein
MDRNIVLSVLAMAVFGFIGFMLLMPEERDDGVQRLPWLVTQDQDGHTQVFGFTLDKTPLAQVRDVLGEEGEIILFAHPEAGEGEDRYRVEAYFEQIYLNRLRADFVVGVALDQAALAAMYERGLRISQLGSGAKKVKLAAEDIERLTQAPISAITYLPWKSLDAEILEKRFGIPAEKRAEPETGVSHWLYPAKGMDVAIDSKGGVVVQYVNSADFARILVPLQAAEEAAKADAKAPAESGGAAAGQPAPDAATAPTAANGG